MRRRRKKEEDEEKKIVRLRKSLVLWANAQNRARRWIHTHPIRTPTKRENRGIPSDGIRCRIASDKHGCRWFRIVKPKEVFISTLSALQEDSSNYHFIYYLKREIEKRTLRQCRLLSLIWWQWCQPADHPVGILRSSSWLSSCPAWGRCLRAHPADPTSVSVTLWCHFKLISLLFWKCDALISLH